MPGGKGRPAVKDCIFSAASSIGFGLAVGERGDDQILEHLLVGGRQQRGVDAHPPQFALGVEREADHAATGLAFDFEAPKLLLRLLKLGLNGLGFFHHAHDIHGVDLLLSRRQRR